MNLPEQTQRRLETFASFFGNYLTLTLNLNLSDRGIKSKIKITSKIKIKDD